MLEAVIHRGVEGLRRLEAPWHRLGARISKPLFSATYEWYACFAQHLAERPDDLFFVELRRSGRCVGIVPLAVQPASFGGLGLRALALPNHPHMNLADMALEDGETLQDFWRPLRKALAKLGLRWSVLLWTPVLQSSAAGRSARALGRRTLLQSDKASCSFDCTLPFDHHSQRFGGRLHNNLKKGRRLEKTGAARFVVATAGCDALPAAYEEFLRLEQSGWKGEEGARSAIHFDARLRDFYRALFDSCSAGLRAEINVMLIEGTPVAAQFALVCGRTRNVLKIAYDESYRQHSPGTVLMENTLKRSCEEAGIDKLSLVTSTPWMQDWHPHSESTEKVWVFRSAFAASVAKFTIRGKGVIERRRRRIGAANAA